MCIRDRSGGFAFEEGNTYGSVGSEEIWYIEGSATIEENVTIYGTVIADLSISFTGRRDKENVTIDAASGYPALLAGTNISGDSLANSTISGLIHAGNTITFDKANNLTINGTIISGNDTSMANDKRGSFVINYDSDIVSNPPPYFEDPGVNLSAWQETY